MPPVSAMVPPELHAMSPLAGAPHQTRATSSRVFGMVVSGISRTPFVGEFGPSLNRLALVSHRMFLERLQLRMFPEFHHK